jgi:hypothetical protein
MAMGHALFLFPAIDVPYSARYSAFSLQAISDSIPAQSIPAPATKSLKSINKIHPTAKPNNYRQTSPELFSAIIFSY